MTHVATFITDTTTGLEASSLARAAAVLPHAGAIQWLAPDMAADLPFAPPPGTDKARWVEAARAAFDGAPVDIAVQPVVGRRKRLLLADMDSTLIEQECIDELADVAGLRREISAVTARAMRGEIAFDQSLKERVALLRGLDLGLALRIVTERMTMMPGARTLVRTMRAQGALTVLASGGFTLFTAHVAQKLGFDRHYGNILDIEAGRLAGTVKPPIFGRAAKGILLRTIRDELQLEREDTMAVGDGANDLAMLEEAGLGVAFRAKPAVAAVARARIDHGDLTALLFLQGIRHVEFVS